MNRINKLLLSGAAGLFFAASAIPQGPLKFILPLQSTKNTPDTMTLKTNIGSFKLIGNGSKPAVGRLEMSFTGTILVSGAEGTVQTEGNVRREYTNDKWKRQAFFGKGKLLVDGKVKAIQWFGRDMTAVYRGSNATIRIYGEFDKNLDTGLYWYGDPAHKVFWGTGGQEPTVPEQEGMIPIVPVPRGGKKGG